MSAPDRQHRWDDAGTSLAEVLVSMVLLGVIGTITSTALVSGQRASTGTTTRVQATGDVRVAHAAATKALRTATTATVSPTAPFVSSSALTAAGSRSVTFYAHDRAATGPTRTTYEALSDGRLVETRVAATVVPASGTDAAYFTWTAPPRARVLLRDVAAGTVLRYYDVTTACPAGCELVPSGTPATLTAAQLVLVDAVEISLSVDRLSSGRTQRVTVTNRIGVRRNLSPVKA